VHTGGGNAEIYNAIFSEFSEKRKLFKYIVDIEYQEYMRNIQDNLFSNPSKLFQFVNNKRATKRIPNAMSYKSNYLTENKDIVD
jgi:hypothetical protein